jgi:hypothetical protein
VRQARDLLALLLLACACLPATAHATQSARLHVSFTPEHLGQGTTVNVSAHIAAPPDRVPSPLSELDIRYPSDLGFDVSGLGLATCSQATLETLGPDGCPADSRMGQGSALAEVPFGPEIIQETAAVAIVRAPREGQLALLFYANGETPVSAPIIFPGLLLPGPGSEESIHINVPLVPSLPEAPDVAVVELHATLGPHGLTYYEHVHDQLVAYHPQGVLLPNKCPHRGFAFSATFSFLDGSHARAYAVVPCPLEGRRARRDSNSRPSVP